MGWPIVGGLANPKGVNTNPGQETTINGSASANTLSTWQQLIASTPRDASALWFRTGGSTNSHINMLTLGVGGSGSEKALINTMIHSVYRAVDTQPSILLPTNIPAGSRIAAQMQSASASDTINTAQILFDSDWFGASGSGIVEAIGYTSGTTKGTVVSGSSTLNATGSYAQLAASTANDYKAIFAIWDLENVTQPAINVGVLFAFDFATGASGSEKIFIPDFFTEMNADNTDSVFNFTPPFLPVIPYHIPAGTRIAVRCRCNSTNATARAPGMVMYGIR